MPEKLHLYLNIIRIMFELKGIIAVRGKIAFGFSPEATSSKILLMHVSSKQ